MCKHGIKLEDKVGTFLSSQNVIQGRWYYVGAVVAPPGIKAREQWNLGTGSHFARLKLNSLSLREFVNGLMCVRLTEISVSRSECLTMSIIA